MGHELSLREIAPDQALAGPSSRPYPFTLTGPPLALAAPAIAVWAFVAVPLAAAVCGAVAFRRSV